MTGTVFSVLRWLPPEAGLLPLLNAAFPDWAPAWGSKSQLLFWPRLADGTEPDLVIITEDSAVVVEAKTGSPFGPDQLRREWDGLRGWGPAAGLERRLLAITTDSTVPGELASHREAAGSPELVGWLSWTHVLRYIRRGQSSGAKAGGASLRISTHIYIGRESSWFLRALIKMMHMRRRWECVR